MDKNIRAVCKQTLLAMNASSGETCRTVSRCCFEVLVVKWLSIHRWLLGQGAQRVIVDCHHKLGEIGRHRHTAQFAWITYTIIMSPSVFPLGLPQVCKPAQQDGILVAERKLATFPLIWAN